MPKASKFSPDEGLTIYDLKDSEAVHYGDQSKGYVGKNLFKNTGESKTSNNVVFTHNADDSIGLNNTASATTFYTIGSVALLAGINQNVILSGCPTGGDVNNGYSMGIRTTSNKNVRHENIDIVDTGNGFRFNPSNPLKDSDGNSVSISDLVLVMRIGNGVNVSDKTFYPMIRLASIVDDTYEPYITPNTEIPDKMSYVDNTVLGAKNIIPNDSRRDTSKSQNGVSWILNADGTVTGTTNGVASTGESRFTITGYIPFTDSLIKKNKAYKISAEVPADAPNNVRLEIALWRDSNTYDGIRYYQDKTREETEFTITSATANGYSLYILVPSGTTISSPITFKPMIRLASDTDKTYQPPTMTNRELTRENKYHAGDIITFHGLSGYISSGATELFFQINGKFDEAIKAIQISGTDVRVRGIKGYIKDDNSVDLSGVNFATYLKLNSFSKFTNQINVSIKTLSGNAFTNVDNNTPISISGAFTITLS